MSDSEMESRLLDYANRVITFQELSEKTKRVLGREAYGRLRDVAVEGAMDVRNEIILSMRNSPPYGKLYLKGRNSRGRAVRHRASAPGFPPRPDTGRLINSIVVDVRFTEVEIGSVQLNPAYPKFLEDGTKRMEARPWLWPAVTKYEPRIKAAMTRAMREIAEEMTR